MPGRVEVEPDALIAAGQIVLTTGEQLSALSEAVKPMVADGLASGMDLAGFNVGVQYGRQSQEFTNALANAANAFKSVGYRLMASGYNYRNADAASTIGGAGPSGGLGPAPQESHPGDAARLPQNLLVPPPTKWYLITAFLPVTTWPNGHPGLMKVTAAQWKNFANGFKVFESMLAAPKAVVGAQHIDESGKMQDELTMLGKHITNLATISDSVAKLVDDYANGVQETQDAIRRILDRLSVDGLLDAAAELEKALARLDSPLRRMIANLKAVLEDQAGKYLIEYSFNPKRCALWKVDPKELTVSFVIDLPSRGDTCFASQITQDDKVTIYNYSSLLDGAEVATAGGPTAAMQSYLRR